MWLVALLISISVSLIAFLVFSYFQRKKKIADRLTSASPSPSTVISSSIRKKENFSDIDLLQKMLKSYSPSRELSVRLKRLGFKINVSMFYLSCIVLGLISYSFIQRYCSIIVSMGIALAITAIPFISLNILHRRYLQQFAEALPSALSVVSSAIKVGHSLQQALKSVVRNGSYPVNEEFQVVLNEVAMGLPLDKALENLYHRTRNPDLKIMIMGISIQQKLGGSLSEMLENLERTIRDRFALLREIKTLSAQGTLSAWVLLMIPLVLIGIYLWRSHDLMVDFLQSPFGKVIICVCLLMQFIGFMGMRLVIKLRD